jgi:hypothetical protein
MVWLPPLRCSRAPIIALTEHLLGGAILPSDLLRVYPYTFPSTTSGDPLFVNSNLYFYRSYFPYPPVTLLRPRASRR